MNVDLIPDLLPAVPISSLVTPAVRIGVSYYGIVFNTSYSTSITCCGLAQNQFQKRFLLWEPYYWALQHFSHETGSPKTYARCPLVSKHSSNRCFSFLFSKWSHFVSRERNGSQAQKSLNKSLNYSCLCFSKELTSIKQMNQPFLSLFVCITSLSRVELDLKECSIEMLPNGAHTGPIDL